ncbi:MAG: TetR family transcriptional regulator [Caulobacteraceae bacterium]|nr:TetR family transcriptional regulator [Caulobacteraceae bacterium]
MVTEFTGGGDPRRSLELLWGVEAPARRGPKPRLSVEDVVRAAIGVADIEGLAALSMRRVAQVLGVSTMSLYTYVPSKAELIDVMLDRVWGEMATPDCAPGDWRAGLRFMACQDRDIGRRHPWMLQVATHRPPLGPNVAARYETAFRTIDGLGLDEIEMDLVIALLENYVRGAVRFDIEADELVRRTGLTDHQWWMSRQSIVADLITTKDFPTARRVGAACSEFYGATEDRPDTFEFGLQRVLDGIAAFIAAHAERP